MMQKRRLGKSELEIAPLMFGGNVFGWTIDQQQSFAVLDRFVDLGGEAIDTADMYACWAPGCAGGESENIIGAWLKRSGKRDKVVLATKGGSWPRLKGLKRETIVKACDESLQRLGVERIDLYQLHRDDKVTPPEDFLSTLAELQRAGKINAIGLSNFMPERLRETIDVSKAMGGPRIDTFQPLYNLMTRDVETTVAPICVREGVSILPFYGLAEGYLTGKYRTEADKQKSMRGFRMDKYMLANGPKVLAAVDAVCARHGARPAHVALAWLLAKPGVAAPIASATSAAQLDETMGALALQLSAEDIALLDSASA
jgi:aryl-alcohol dehydrogenase-like predicted oxidoreductase